MCPHGMKLRGKSMKEAVQKLNIDGIVFASNRSCKPYSITQMDQQKLMTGQFGVPSVMIEVDHADARKYARESTFTRLEALIESIETSRRAA
ncbi:MAG: 2-hydroxyacyl-CoA dehydratase [Desulfobacteraceae bacterium]|nr:MAG: 2-hydroxyacyl-CoA dehydratase [Desulfobacteraceae bacterium]